MTASCEFPAAGTAAAGRAVAFVVAEQFASQGAGRAAFAHAFRADEQVAVRQPAADKGAAEQVQGLGLADDMREGHDFKGIPVAAGTASISFLQQKKSSPPAGGSRFAGSRGLLAAKLHQNIRI